MDKQDIALNEMERSVRLLREQLTNEDLEAAIELLREARHQNRMENKKPQYNSEFVVRARRAVLRPCMLSLHGARIPTLAEYESFSNLIPMCLHTWPLDEHGRPDSVKIVDRFGKVYDKNCTYQMGIRPMIEISVSQETGLLVGDKFFIGDYAFTLVTPQYALCDTCIALSAFSLTGPYYLGSLAERTVETWYEKLLKKQ